MTIATWMRDFVYSHPSYKHDSVLTQDMVFDLLVACKNIGEGVEPCSSVLGDIVINRYYTQYALLSYLWDYSLQILMS